MTGIHAQSIETAMELVCKDNTKKDIPAVNPNKTKNQNYLL